jgi:hypothetical protein
LTLLLFATKLDWEASTATAELILEGDYSNHKLADIQELLNSLCTPLSPFDDIPANIMIDRFK